ncbi:MAG: ATP-binding protein [Nitrospirae bacterium]|nr:ATP-binding protein [Candidatus Manganitrophaceae bacterium]
MSKEAFRSRTGLLENLKGQLLAGRWAAVVGGPMIGKTTLARRLKEMIDAGPNRAVLIDLNGLPAPDLFWPKLLEALLQQGIGPETKSRYHRPPNSFPELMTQLHHLYEKAPSEIHSRPIVLLLDNAEALLPFSETLIPQIINLAQELTLPPIQAISWIGGASFGDWVLANPAAFKPPLRLYPLSAIPIREAREIIREALGPTASSEAADRIWNDTGGHPLLLNHAFGEEGGPSVEALQAALRNALRPEEEAILDRLDPAGRWTILDDLRDREGQKIPKPQLDRLCMLGLTIRTLIDGIAAIRLTSPFFNQVSGR